MRARAVLRDEAESNAHWRKNDHDGEQRRTLMLRAVGVLLAVALSVWAFAQFV